MDDRLRVNDHIDLIGRHAEQPVCLDHLQAFVHQGRRVDRDLASHPPRRMLQRGGGIDAVERVGAHFAERPAGGGEDRAA